jgi:tetratricopeptide (TPR) repeat protein
MLVLVILTLIVYLFTLSPSVYLGDSGELTAAAFCLGVPHPSGYPVYTLVGKLFCLLPFGNVGFRMNLMSACLAVLTLLVVYLLILRMTSSRVGAFSGAGVAAFTPVFWWQTVAAEVYTLHAFFVALMLWLLWRWDEGREFYILALFSFITGLSFGNHLQTVMLAPAVFFLILSGDHHALLQGKRFMILSLFFLAAFLVYLYLPIRTGAGAAIHWGNPDTWDRFWAHVSGRSHRGGYVLNLDLVGYATRAEEAVLLLWRQFGATVLVCFWGFLKLPVRWRVCFLLVILFDFFYTIGLNTVSLEITPFNLCSSIVLAILMGNGIAEALNLCEKHAAGVKRMVKGAALAIPLIFLALNFSVSDQSRNYLAHEHMLNIFRTARPESVLFVNGDNYLFPLVYGRLVERMGEDVRLYDRLNLLFKMPALERSFPSRTLAWEEKRNHIEQKIIEESGSRDVFYAVFGPYAIALPRHQILIPEGILYRVVKREEPLPLSRFNDVWRSYTRESFYDGFPMDYMNRQIKAYFFFCLGKHFILAGQPSLGLNNMKVAAEAGYDDELIHSDMAVFLTDHGFLEEARAALGEALLYHEDLSGVYNNWGYYYHKAGDNQRAADSFQKAVDLKPERYVSYNNLGFALLEMGNKEKAHHAFQESLRLNPNQPEIKNWAEKTKRESIL